MRVFGQRHEGGKSVHSTDGSLSLPKPRQHQTGKRDETSAETYRYCQRWFEVRKRKTIICLMASTTYRRGRDKPRKTFLSTPSLLSPLACNTAKLNLRTRCARTRRLEQVGGGQVAHTFTPLSSSFARDRSHCLLREQSTTSLLGGLAAGAAEHFQKLLPLPCARNAPAARLRPPFFRCPLLPTSR